MLRLRQYQADMVDGLYRSWNAGNRSTVLVAPTGAGKTVVMAKITSDVSGGVCSIAHRQELVQQISASLTRSDQPHNLIAPDEVIRTIVRKQIEDAGFSYHDPNSRVTVGAVDTIHARRGKLKQWAAGIQFWNGDEGHHFLSNNKWGTVIEMFGNAHGAGYTATPRRCDKKSLHRAQGGVYDDLVEGPSMRELIDQGHLCEYRLFGPPQSIKRDEIKISPSTGDFSAPALRQAAERSTITGDIVDHYLRIAPGKRGISFVVDTTQAEQVAQRYVECGVPAVAITAKTPGNIRNELIRQFERGQILQLVNVDLFGEGFDVPAVEVVSMGRPTESLTVYLQQFGRALRVIDGKQYGIVIDHVGNWQRHGLPDAQRVWRLYDDEAGKRRKNLEDDVFPVTTCMACFMAYEAITKTCPYCGHVHQPEQRSEPKFVDGDLIEFSPELLKQLRDESNRLMKPFDPATDVPKNLKGTPAEGAIKNRHNERMQAQHYLREAISYWAGIRRDKGQQNSEIYRRFYHKFKIDIASAQGLNRADAEALTARVIEGYWHD